MGKIFKALEKAEKRDITKKTRPQKGQDMPDRNQSVHSVVLRHTVDKTDHQTHRPKKKKEELQSNIEEMIIEKEDRESSVDPSFDLSKPIKPKTVTSESKKENYDHVSVETLAENNIVESQPIERITASKTTIERNTINNTQNDSVIMNTEQELQRKVQNLKPLISESNIEDKKPFSTIATRKGINVNYTRTSVQISDLQKLKDNKVLSVFEDFETTNQFKILRTQLLRKMKDSGGNSILVTSANPCEGKTFTSINLGVSIAKEFDRTVLIIDADIRKPAYLHTDFSTEFFSLQVGKGLTDYLVGDADIEDVLINPGIDKLTLIPGGVPVDNSPELLNSPRMEEMMAEIKSRYPSDRIVIVDGPALLPFPDAMILSRYVDGILPVVESERTASEDVKKMMAHLKEVNVLGVVLNKNKG